MSETRTRRQFTAEFKAQAVKGVLDGRGLSEVATELGLSMGQLSTWRTKQLAEGSAEALAVREADEAETLRLRREVKRLGKQNLILRKATAVFAKGIA
jgi:transposase